MTRRSLRCTLPLVGGAVLLAASGCAATSGSSPASSTPTASASPAASEWPDGADDDTPACQDASAATLEVVNDALRSTSAEDGLVETVLPWLSARPDRELGVWTLTGVVANAETDVGTEGGFFVVWATETDPTDADFSGEVYTVSGVGGYLTGLPPLEPAYVGPSDMEDAPAAALNCGMRRTELDAPR